MMEHGIAEKPWIDLHATLRGEGHEHYTLPHALPSLISDLLQSPSTVQSSAPHKLTPAARKLSAIPTLASQPAYPSSAVFHCKFAYDGSGYLLLISDWIRVWCHRATAEQVQLEKAEFAQQVALSTADETITRIIQPLLTGPHNQRQHVVSFQPANTGGASNAADLPLSKQRFSDLSSQPAAEQAVLLLTSSMEMGPFRLQWQFDCLPFLSPLHQSSLLLHLTLLPQQAMITQLHAQLTAARSGQQDGSPRVKEEVRAANNKHEPTGAGRVAASQGRSQHVAPSQQQARSPSPIGSPPASSLVKSEDRAVPTLDSLYEQSMRASQSQSQTEEAVEAEAAQAQAAEEQKEAQKGADGEGYWDDAKQEWVQGEKEKKRLEKAKQSDKHHTNIHTSHAPPARCCLSELATDRMTLPCGVYCMQ